MSKNKETELSWNEFLRVEMRVGTVISAEFFKETTTPAFKMTIDFGEYGIRKTSAQITDLYTCEEMIGEQLLAVINFPPKQIANIMSECLVLGAVGDDARVTLINPKSKVKNGTRIK